MLATGLGELGRNAAPLQRLSRDALAGDGCLALTPSQIARKMGLRRQSVQRLVDVLLEQGHLVLDDNPDHRRAKLVRLTAEGRRAYEAISPVQAAWVNDLGQGLDLDGLKGAIRLLREVEERVLKEAESAGSDRA